MDKISSSGSYASFIEQYIAYKRSLGFKMDSDLPILRRFDKLAQRMNGLATNGISKELFDEWSKPSVAESEFNRVKRMYIVRRFSAYLQLLGYESYLPKISNIKSTFIPHIFTSTEMAAIFRECDRLSNSRRYTFSIYSAMPVLIRMLYGTGIRISEAASLNHKDVDLTNGVLKLYGTKNGCDRIAPMSLSLREVCKDYVAHKESLGLNVEGESPFFSSYDGTRRLVPHTAYSIFRIIVHRAGIPHGGRGNGVRLHDLRHTFCVNAMIKMMEAGQDLYHVMPILMTYMGHKSLEATNRYVRITQEVYPGIINKLDEAYKYLFPEISVDLQNI